MPPDQPLRCKLTAVGSRVVPEPARETSSDRRAALLFVSLGWAKPGDKARLAEQACGNQPTYPGSRPVHLEAHIVETTNPQSAYRARIEEFWVSPGTYRRVIEAPEFAQALVVNGDQVYGKNAGDYYPCWLHALVTAIFDPLSPMRPQYVHATLVIPVG